MRESRKRSADEERRGPRSRSERAPLIEEVVDVPETECEVWRPCFAEGETVPMEEVECRLVAIVDGLPCTLVRGVLCRVSGGSRINSAGRESTRAHLW